MRRNIGQGPVARLQPALWVEGRRKDRRQPVIIRLRNRVVFVAVAAGTIDRQPEQVAGHGFDRAGQHAVPNVGRVQLVFVGVIGAVRRNVVAIR